MRLRGRQGPFACPVIGASRSSLVETCFGPNRPVCVALSEGPGAPAGVGSVASWRRGCDFSFFNRPMRDEGADDWRRFDPAACELAAKL